MSASALSVSSQMNLAIFLSGKPFRVNVSNFVPGGIPGDVKENIWTKFRQKKYSANCVLCLVCSLAAPLSPACNGVHCDAMEGILTPQPSVQSHTMDT